jgi:hypothetical protein
VVGDELAAVLTAAQSGSEAALILLWRDANPALLRYLRVIAPDAAEDVAAETQRGCNAMTDPGVPHDDMLSFLWRSRMDIPQIGDEALDALLAQDRGPGEDAAPLREAPSHGELTGLDPVLADFRGAGGGMPDGFHRSRRRRPASPHQTHYAGAPVGPDPAGPAAHSLCTAYSHAEAHGSAQLAVAFMKLAAAAGGGGKVAAYCASAPRPGAGTHGKSATPPAGPPPGLAIHRSASTRARRHHDDEPDF